MIPLAIARQTVREALRRRVMWIFLICGVFLIALGPVFGFLSPKDSQTVLRSLGLAAILLAGLFITIGNLYLSDPRGNRAAHDIHNPLEACSEV
jgi:drug/metabolite transporter (DMT)-like permease